MHSGGKGAYTAIDAVSGEMTKQLAFALRDGGTVLVYGALSNDPIQMDTLDTLYKYKRAEVCHSSFPWLCLIYCGFDALMPDNLVTYSAGFV